MQFYAENEKKYSSQALKIQSEHRSARKVYCYVISFDVSDPTTHRYTLRRRRYKLFIFAHTCCT